MPRHVPGRAAADATVPVDLVDQILYRREFATSARPEREYFALLRGFDYLMIPRETRPGVPDERATGERNDCWRHGVIRRGSRARGFRGCDPRRGRCGFGGDSTVADGKDESSGLAPGNNSHRASESEVGHALCG